MDETRSVESKEDETRSVESTSSSHTNVGDGEEAVIPSIYSELDEYEDDVVEDTAGKLVGGPVRHCCLYTHAFLCALNRRPHALNSPYKIVYPTDTERNTND